MEGAINRRRVRPPALAEGNTSHPANRKADNRRVCEAFLGSQLHARRPAARMEAGDAPDGDRHDCVMIDMNECERSLLGDDQHSVQKIVVPVRVGATAGRARAGTYVAELCGEISAGELIGKGRLGILGEVEDVAPEVDRALDRPGRALDFTEE